MKQTTHTTDVLTLIGMMATIAGILLCLIFLFTPVTFGSMGANTLIGHSPDLQLSMRWIQPVLGRAIVEDALIRQRSNVVVTAMAFNDGRARLEPGSVQWVVGRVIVELNRLRMGGGLSRSRNQDDLRIVSIARYAVEQFQEGAVGEDRMRASE